MNTSKQHKGHFCEELVLQYFLKKNFKLLGRNIKTPFAEVDLLFLNYSCNELVMVEVKKSQYPEEAIHSEQLQRLSRARSFLETQSWKLVQRARYKSRLDYQVRCHLANVFENGELQVIEDVLLELV